MTIVRETMAEWSHPRGTLRVRIGGVSRSIRQGICELQEKL